MTREPLGQHGRDPCRSGHLACRFRRDEAHFFDMTMEDALCHRLIWALSLSSSEGRNFGDEGWDLTAVESELSDFLVISSCPDPPSSLRGAAWTSLFLGIPRVFTFKYMEQYVLCDNLEIYANV